MLSLLEVEFVVLVSLSEINSSHFLVDASAAEVDDLCLAADCLWP